MKFIPTGGELSGADISQHRKSWREFLRSKGIQAEEPKRTGRCLAGTALSELLSGPPFFIEKKTGCRSGDHKRIMDSWGCEKCEERIDTISSWLREEATKRGMPYFDAVGKILIRRAIVLAKRRENNEEDVSLHDR